MATLRSVRKILLISIFFLCICFTAGAQFRSAATSGGGGLVASPPGANVQSGSINGDSDVPADSLRGFSFATMYRGLARKEELKYGYALLSSAIMPGSMQIYNKDYWKLPIFYGGIGAGIYGGIHFNKLYKQTDEARFRTYSYLSYAGAALFYWSSMMDGVVRKPTDRNPDPGKAAVLSALLPGLGQAYNGDWWHIPIWYGGFAVCAYCWHTNDIQYRRFSYDYQMITDVENGYIGRITADEAKYYRDLYRRYRDYSIIATVLVYALNIIDANVFSYMSDFNVSDDLALNIEPALITPFNPSKSFISAPNAFGVNLSLTFK